MVNFTALAFCDTTDEDEKVREQAVLGNLTFHHLGLILSAVCGLIAVFMSCYLMVMHATHYLKPHEQKHIIRILFMVPIYSIASFCSYYFYLHTVYFDVLRDCYEAFAIASFFSLMCAYIAPDIHGQKEYFRTIRPKHWVFPLALGKHRMIKQPPRSGLTWFNIVWFCIFQYCFVRIFMTIVAVATQATDRYCLDSLSPAFAHVWVTCIEAVAVTVAMYCVIQFYIQLKDDIGEHRPFLKVLAIKGVIFFSFWQTLLIDFLVSSKALKPNDQLSLPDFRVGLPSLLICIEMALFSVMHLFAYPWKVYDIKRSPVVAAESAGGYMQDPQMSYKGGPFGLYAFAEAYNPWDIIKAVGRGFRWMAVGRRYRESDVSYKAHLNGSADQTALEERNDRHGEHDGLKANGVYQKLDGGELDSRDPSPAPNHDRRSYHQANTPYGGRTQPYGVAHPSLSQPGSRPGTSGGDGSQGSPPRHAQHPPVPTPAPTLYGVAPTTHDTAYHGAGSHGNFAPGAAAMPNPDQFR